MPTVRGQFIPAIESTGRAKTVLNVLLWLSTPAHSDLRALHTLEALRTYLASIDPYVCAIRLLVPAHHIHLTDSLLSMGVRCDAIEAQRAANDFGNTLKPADAELTDAVATALSADADCLVTNNFAWFPFVEEVEKVASVFLTDCQFLLSYSEIFARGHDVPWAFSSLTWNAPWMAFYQSTENRTFGDGINLLGVNSEKQVSAEAQETGRSLVLNRLGNLCFTRDRLLYYEIQRLASKRAGWTRQQFSCEIQYFLNFNYLLIWGTFDHAAVFVSQLLNLGLNPRRVSATNPQFLSSLKEKNAQLHAVFTNDRHRKFIERIGALRHFAAHRGMLTPTKVVRALEHDPTTEELDADIKTEGLEEALNMLPPGPSRESYREMLRTNARYARYEQDVLLEDVVPIELDGEHGFIKPSYDTTWNFEKVMAFLKDIFRECSALKFETRSRSENPSAGPVVSD